MRKLLASVLVLVAAVPAVALASDAVNATTTSGVSTATAIDLRAGQLRDRARHRRLVEKRRARKRARRRARQHVTVSPALQAIAACESGGNPHAIGGGGAFRGKYQFDRGTWASVGGSGDPASAPEAEQDKRAAILYARAGSSPWPICGH